MKVLLGMLLVVAPALSVADCIVDGEHLHELSKNLLISQMKQHFDTSIKQLFLSFKVKSKLMERPGLGKVIRERSDANWEEGLSYAKKFFQRGGLFNYSTFQEKFNFVGTSPSLVADYNTALKDLVDDSTNTANSLHSDFASHLRHHHCIRTDPDMAQFIQEKTASEWQTLRDLKIMQTNLESLSGNAMALHIFDGTL